MPKILFLNTYYSMGGAAVSSKRIFESLQKEDSLDVKMLVQKGQSDLYPEKVLHLESNFLASQKVFFNFAAERFYFLRYEASKAVRFAFSPANTGTDLSHHPWVQEADILHLNWINFGFLSIQGLQKLFALQKPMVWTLHDMWAFTGGCHYAQHCRHFEKSCGNCFYLRKPSLNDLSQKILHKKIEKLTTQGRIHFVGSSQWLVSELEKSSFFKKLPNARASNIKTPIDLQVYRPSLPNDQFLKHGLRPDKFKVLFGAMKVSDERKGFAFLKEAISIIENKYQMIAQDFELIIFGKAPEDLDQLFQTPIKNLGMLRGDEALVQAYSAVDVFVLPSLDDNLPNTIIEAMACGTPVIAFKSGGIPEMIDHEKNGYLADFKSSEDLAQGLNWAHFHWSFQKINPRVPAYQKIREAARHKATTEYTQEHINQQYQELYQDILDLKSEHYEISSRI